MRGPWFYHGTRPKCDPPIYSHENIGKLFGRNKGFGGTIFSHKPRCAMVRRWCMAYCHPSLNENPYIGYLNPCWWTDDNFQTRAYHPILDGILRERSRSTNAPSRLRGVRGVRRVVREWKERVDHETVQHGSSQEQLQAVDTRPRQALCKNAW